MIAKDWQVINHRKVSSESKKKNRDAHLGKTFTKEHKNNMSKNNARYWKGKHHTEQQKENQSKVMTGRHWYNNGIKQVFVVDCPEGFVLGRL